MRFEDALLARSRPLIASVGGIIAIGRAPIRHLEIRTDQHHDKAYPSATGEDDVAQICAAIVAAKGTWLLALRDGEPLSVFTLQQMAKKSAVSVAVRPRHGAALKTELLRTLRGIITPSSAEAPLAGNDFLFAGAMSFPPYIHQTALRLVSENPGISWPALIRRLSEIFIMRTVSGERSGSVGGGSFAKSRVMSTFRKQAKDGGKDKLIDEISFLKRLPKTLRGLYPVVLSAEKPDRHTVVMHQEFIDWPTVRAHLLHEGTDPHEIIQRLRALLNLLQRVSYNASTQSAPSDYIDRLHFRRVKQRIQLTCDLCPLFRTLVEAREVTINGKTYLNIPKLLDIFDKSPSLLAFATPPSVSPLVHGDLHFDNILLDRASTDFKLVDPRGYKLCDIYYDLGKLSHSVNGKYDFLHEGLFSLDYKATGPTIDSSLHFINDHLVRTYDLISSHLHVWCAELTGDDYSVGRMLFNEAMHFAAIMPFHLIHDEFEHRAVAIYLTGVRLMNKFRAEWL